MKNIKPIRNYGRDPKSINDRIEYIRRTFKYSPSGFAKKIGSSKAAMLNVLSEDKSDDPSFKMMKSICRIFPVAEEWLLLGYGDPFTLDDVTPFIYTEKITEPTIDPEVNMRMKEVRKKLELSQTLFADSINSTRDVVAFIENNRTALNIPMFKRIVKKHKINPVWFLFGTGNMISKKP